MKLHGKAPSISTDFNSNFGDPSNQPIAQLNSTQSGKSS